MSDCCKETETHRNRPPIRRQHVVTKGMGFNIFVFFFFFFDLLVFRRTECSKPVTAAESKNPEFFVLLFCRTGLLENPEFR